MASVDARVAATGTTATHARVLLVDDHSLLRTGVANIINQEPDLEVVAEAANGRDGIDAFLVHHPDVVLMDLRMPGMDGITAIRHIRAKSAPKSGLPVIVVTADTAVDLRERCIAAGADDVILKPVAMGALLNAMGRMVAKASGGDIILD